VELRVNGIERIEGFILQWAPAEAELTLITRDLQRSECSLERRFVPDKAGLAGSTELLAPVASQMFTLKDGAYYFTATCPSIDGKLKAEYRLRGFDNLPERCLDFDFQGGPLAATTVSELSTGMVGSWAGCVSTPWTPVYWVDITFRADGGYSAVSGEMLDGWEMRATYYGMDADHPDKLWVVLDMVDGEGFGRLDAVNESVFTITHLDLRSVRLMGDALRFDLFMLRDGREYGPLVFQLLRD